MAQHRKEVQKKYRETHREADKAYRDAHKVERGAYLVEHREALRLKAKEYTIRIKTKVLTHYGRDRLSCVYCGETRLACLSIDHINGGGLSHIRTIGNKGGRNFYNWLIHNNFPEGYQTLCMNCQWVKRYENNEQPQQHKS